MASHITPKAIAFGAFEFDLELGELRRNGIKLKLREKSAAVLTLLLERPGELVKREELSARLWPSDVFVDFDNNLNTAVTALREALGDSADEPRYIETFPRRGYRFIAPLREAARSAQLVSKSKLRIGVLPFENLSGDPTQEYFSDGLTEELITRLAVLAPSRLAVVARTSVMHYKGSRKGIAEVGRELQLDYAVGGSVRRADNRVRISAQLIQAGDQTHLWAESYDFELGDILKLHSEVAQAIAANIDVAVSPVETRKTTASVDPEVYDLYVRGLHHFNKSNRVGFEKAIESFQQAIDRDPHYAPAYAKLAVAHAFSAFWGYDLPSRACPQAETEARKALALDPSLIDAHIALGFVQWFYNWNFAACRHEYELAVRLGANDSLAHWHLGMFLSSMCEDPKALTEVSIARELDPLSVLIRSMSGWVYYWSRQYSEAITQARSTLEIDQDCLQACYVLGHALIGAGQFEEAVGTFQTVFDRFGDSLSLGYLGMACGFAGDRDGAERARAQLEARALEHDYVPSITFASICVGLGENKKALDWLEKAYAEHDAQVLWLRVSTVYDSLRREPRCKALIRKLALPPAIRTRVKQS